MQNPTDYLTNKLKTSAQYQLNDEEKKQIKQEGIEQFIFTKLASKKFRKFKMDADCITRTKHAIETRIKANEPIMLVFPQGGYKLWRLPSSPTVDWAEFFNIAYLLEYIAPIAAAYNPGVTITYYLHTLLMEKHDNLTREEIKSYGDSFEKLLEAFRKYLPDNITLSIMRDTDLYEREEYFAELEKAKEQVEKEYQDFPQTKKDALASMARLNIKWGGAEDWTILSEKEKEEKIYQAALYETGVGKLQRVIEKVKSPENILAFTIGTKEFIGIGSTRASIAKYWVGFGGLTKRNDSYLPIVLTPSQYEQASKQTYTTEKVNLIDLPNFSEILVFDKPFTFSGQ